MKTKNIALFLVLSLVILSSAVFAAPGVPHKFFGNVTIDGALAPDGTTVSSKMDGVLVANTTTLNGKYGYSPKTYYVYDPNNNRDGITIQFFVNDIDTGARVNFSNGYSTKLNLAIPQEVTCDPFQLFRNESYQYYDISPKNRDKIADNFLMTLMMSNNVSNGSIAPFADGTSYEVVFSNQTSIVKRISAINASFVNVSWDGVIGHFFLPQVFPLPDIDTHIYASDGEYNITLYLMNELLNKTTVFDMGRLVIDNDMDFLVQNSTPMTITPQKNFTFNVTFPQDTLYWDINGQTRGVVNGPNYSTAPKFVNLSWDGNTLSIPGISINPCSYYKPSEYREYFRVEICGPINNSSDPIPSPWGGGGGSSSTCSSNGGNASAPISNGYRNITITAYDYSWNKKTKIISVYVDLRETYFSQTFNQYWNSFFLPRIVLEDVPDMNGNYSVQNILSSLDNNYEILYYYNEDIKNWMSYSPNRPLNDLTDFIDNSSKPYWIKMNTSDTLIIK